MGDIGKSGEDYLEAILILEKGENGVRSVDIAEHLGFSKPSVSRAVGQLAGAGLVVITEGRRVRLTPAGRQKARQVYEKHRFFTRILVAAGVDEKQAAKEACLIEHTISDESFAALKNAFTKRQHNREEG